MTTTKLQLALDVLTTKEALYLANETRDSIDVIEIGTPLIKHEGIQLVKKMREEFPEKDILVDLKTMDVGEYESDYCFEVGADVVTVLGAADIDTIKGSIKSAKKFGKKVMVDMINVEDKIGLANEVNSLGADYVGIHSGIDQQNKGESPLNDLINVKLNSNSSVVVAGGININNIDEIASVGPEVVVVGGAITGSSNPKQAAKEIKEKLQNVKMNEDLQCETQKIGQDIMKVVKTSLSNTSQEKFDETIKAILDAKRVFVVGSGRSGLIGKIFAMRLMHLGIEVYIVGETNTPAIDKSDLLIAISASGKTSSVLHTTQSSKDLGASILCVVANPVSKLYELSEYSILIDSRNKSIRQDKAEETNRFLPMGTSFEISSLIYLESIVSEIMKRENITEYDMKQKHTNI